MADKMEMGDGDASQTVKLRTSDSKIFNVPLEVAKMFSPIQAMFNEEFNIKDSDDPIDLANVKSEILVKVVEYAEKHLDDKKKEENDEDLNDDDDESYSKISKDELSDWDCEFLKVEKNILKQIILAANYLDIPSLLNAACTVIVKKIRGKQPDEIRQMLNLKNNLTEAQVIQITDENKWIEEK